MSGPGKLLDTARPALTKNSDGGRRNGFRQDSPLQVPNSFQCMNRGRAENGG